MKLAIFGFGGMGRELIEIARQRIDASPEPMELVFVDDKFSDPIYGIDVLSPDELDLNDEVVIGVGNGSIRKRIAEKYASLRLVSLYSKTAIISPSAKIGSGAVFCDYTLCNDNVIVGLNFQCNYFSYVAHDCVVGDFVTFAPAVRCNGNVHIGDEAYIGSGATIRQGLPDRPLMIGAGATIGMGAVVTKDVPAGETWVGNPARPLDRTRR